MDKGKPIAISLPVNLRNYYPSETARNFFNSVYVSHVLGPQDTLETVAPVFDAKLKEMLHPENIKAQMDEYEKLEHMPGIRLVPLFIKNAAVRFFNHLEEEHVTAVLSNMGRVDVPEALRPYIRQFAAFSSCEGLFTCVCSYGMIWCWGRHPPCAAPTYCAASIADLSGTVWRSPSMQRRWKSENLSPLSYPGGRQRPLLSAVPEPALRSDEAPGGPR